MRSKKMNASNLQDVIDIAKWGTGMTVTESVNYSLPPHVKEHLEKEAIYNQDMAAVYHDETVSIREEGNANKRLLGMRMAFDSSYYHAKMAREALFQLIGDGRPEGADEETENTGTDEMTYGPGSFYDPILPFFEPGAGLRCTECHQEFEACRCADLAEAYRKADLIPCIHCGNHPKECRCDNYGNPNSW